MTRPFTSFNWIVRAGDSHGTGTVYGYKEALGHCAYTDHMRDKDGISAADLGRTKRLTL